jgi:hypothetical protein
VPNDNTIFARFCQPFFNRFGNFSSHFSSHFHVTVASAVCDRIRFRLKRRSWFALRENHDTQKITRWKSRGEDGILFLLPKTALRRG